MKKTTNINLAGYPFIIDEDAYHLLKDYLDTIRYAYDTNDDAGELASDIESRIAELLLENKSGGVMIVSFEEISKVIERIGNPSDFIEVDETYSEKSTSFDTEEIKSEEVRFTPPPYNPEKTSRNPFSRKRLFRDPQNSMLGGVCSGIAAYLNIDVTLVRLLTVLLFFLSATTVAIVYIILWIVIPEARTPIQRMQMTGQDPTVENIGKTVTENFQDENRNMNSDRDNGGSTFSRFISNAVSIFIKCLVVLGLIITVPVFLALALSFIGCIIAVFVIIIGFICGLSVGNSVMFDSTLEGLFVFYILLAVIGGIVTLGVPLWLFIMSAFRKTGRHTNQTQNRSILIVWLIGIALVCVFTVLAVKKGHELDDSEWKPRIEKLQETSSIDETEEDEIENVKIDNDGLSVKTSEGIIKVEKGKITYSKNKEIAASDTVVVTKTEVMTDTVVSNLQSPD